MIFRVPLSQNFDYYFGKVDKHIDEDFEYKLPDYGKRPFHPHGFHFKRKGKTVRGIYRSRYIKGADSITLHSLFPSSTHMCFVGRMVTDKKGNNSLLVFVYPQLIQLFILIASFVLTAFLVKSFFKTHIYVIFFALVFIYTFIETVIFSIHVKEQFMSFFN